MNDVPKSPRTGGGGIIDVSVQNLTVCCCIGPYGCSPRWHGVAISYPAPLVHHHWNFSAAAKLQIKKHVFSPQTLHGIKKRTGRSGRIETRRDLVVRVALSQDFNAMSV